MPAILMSDFSVYNAENFINSVICDESNMYIAVSRGYTTGTDLTVGTGLSATQLSKDDYLKWDDESNPPTPRDTINQEEDFRNHIIGIKKVTLNNIRLMVPRVQWKAGLTDFRPIDKSRLMGKRAQNYYCVTSENEVWQCMSVPYDEDGRVKPTREGCEPSLAIFTNTAIVTEYGNDGTTIVNVDENSERTNKPTEVKTSKDFPARGEVKTTNVKIDTLNQSYFYENKTADGYVWRFLYDIETSLVNNGLLLKNWMPVPYNNHAVYGNGYGGTITDKQNKYGDNNANETLGAYRVLVNVEIGDCGTSIPYETIYRQVGIIMNPRTKLTNSISETTETEGDYDPTIQRPNTLGSLLTGDSYSNNEFDTNSGLLVFLDNKKPISRDASQLENVQLLLVF